jgi:hypothetical protein
MKMIVVVVMLMAVTGCANTIDVLEDADYVCITGDVDGYFTDSRASGRVVKVPEGETLTPELAEVLCDGRV